MTPFLSTSKGYVPAGGEISEAIAEVLRGVRHTRRILCSHFELAWEDSFLTFSQTCSWVETPLLTFDSSAHPLPFSSFLE